MILHIVKRDDWENAIHRGEYAPASLDTEGFIHCSTAAQVVESANLFYRGQTDLMIICVDEGQLTSQLIYEPAVRVADQRADGLFPHIYGALNLEAVSQVCEFPCDAEGRFVLPSAVSVA
jgi:uncharacterized protein (DUF952 family)